MCQNDNHWQVVNVSTCLHSANWWTDYWFEWFCFIGSPVVVLTD